MSLSDGLLAGSALGGGGGGSDLKFRCLHMDLGVKLQARKFCSAFLKCSQILLQKKGSLDQIGAISSAGLELGSQLLALGGNVSWVFTPSFAADVLCDLVHRSVPPFSPSVKWDNTDPPLSVNI